MSTATVRSSLPALPASPAAWPRAGARFPAGDDTATADLVRAAACSDPAAWNALVRRFANLVRSVARRHGLNDADSADVCQTVWLQLFEHLSDIRQPERLAGWLATTARNECRRVIRQKERTRPVDTNELDVKQEGAPDLASATEAAERAAFVRSVLAALPDRQRTLLGALMMDPAPSYQDVATGLNIPMGSIGPTRQRSLRAIRAKCLAASVLLD